MTAGRLFLILFLFTVSTAQANRYDEAIRSGKVRDYPIHEAPLFEVGASIGTPAIFGNLILAYWKGGKIPLVFRLSGMYWNRTQGVQWELGFAVDRHGDLRQTLTGGGLLVEDRTENWSGLGVFYTLNWYGFYVQPGLGFGRGSKRKQTPQPLFQVGYTYFFEL